MTKGFVNFSDFSAAVIFTFSANVLAYFKLFQLLSILVSTLSLKISVFYPKHYYEVYLVDTQEVFG